MKKSKILIFSLLFTLIALIFGGLYINVKADSYTTNSAIYVKGAQVRTNGTPGIRFVGCIDSSYDTTNVTKYGVALAFGEADVADILVGGTVNGKKVLTGETNSVNANNYYYVNLINIPSTMFGQKITTRSYVVDNGQYVYSDTVTTRSLGEVVLKAKNNNESTELIESVFTSLNKDYKKTFVDQRGQVHFDDAIYESSTANLAKVFVSDWNKMFGTSLDAATAFISLGSPNYSSPFKTSARNNSTTDPTGANITDFFRNEAMYAKWGWMLDYITHELKDGVGYEPCMTQIDCILNNKTDSTGNWYYGYTLASFIQSIFCGKGSSTGSGRFNFETYPEKLALIINYNNKIYADLSNTNLVLKNSEYKLGNISSKTGYEIEGWTDGTNTYNEESKYIVSDYNTVLTATYSPIEYSINFYNGETELSNLNSVYTIEGEVILPDYQLEGYEFLGWYNNAEFTGNPVTKVEEGSTGDKVFYAKMQVKEWETINVTYDLNGAYFPMSDDANAKIIAIYSNTEYSNQTVDITYLCDTGVTSKNSLRWQYKVLLQYDSILNAFKVVCLDAAKASANDAAAQAGVTWTHALSNSKTNISTQFSLGQYIVFENTPKVNDKNLYYVVLNNAEEVAEFELSSTSTVTLKEPCDLLTPPTRDGYTFVGWESSVDGSIITEYPGYKTNVGNITYTAQWVSPKTVNYVFNGANTMYKSEEEAIADFLKDFNTCRNKSHTAESFYALGSWNEINDVYNFFYTEPYSSKWMWLADYISTVAVVETNKNAFYDLVNKTYETAGSFNSANSNYIYVVAYELRGWVGQKQYTQNSNYKSADYANLDDSLFLNALSKASKYQYENVTTLLTGNDMYYPGHTFLGWYDNEALTGNPVSISKVANGATLYAKWDVIKYNVNYNLNNPDATIANSNVSVDYTTSYNLVTPTYDSTKWIFNGWFTDEAFTNPITKINAYTTGTINVYASWTLIVYPEVTFDYEGGVTKELYENNGSIVGTVQINNYNGSFFSKYTTDIFVYDTTNKTNPQWSNRVFFEVNKYTGLFTVVSTIESGIIGEWPANAQYMIVISEMYEGTAAENFHFSNIKAGDVLMFDTEIKSITDANIANVTFFDGTIENETVVEVVKNDYKFVTPVRVGYEFGGWYDSNNNKYDEFADFKGQSEITLYAKWVAKSYTVNYVLNNNNASVPNTSVLVDNSIEYTLVTPTYDKNIYIFEGWYTDDSYTTLIDSLPPLQTGDVTVYAKWSAPETYTVTYVLNNNDASLPNTIVTINNTSTYNLVTPTFDTIEWVFLGWFTDQACTKQITSINAFNKDNVTVYAGWAEMTGIECSTSFDYEGGVSEKLYKTNGTVDSTLQVNSYNGDYWTYYASRIFITNYANDYKAKFTNRIYIGKDDYTGLYKVISTIPNGTASTWPNGAEYVITIGGDYNGTLDDSFTFSKINAGDVVFINKTITAISTSNIGTFTFYNGTVSNEVMTETVNESYVLPTPYKTGYGFAGWYDANDNLYDEISDFAGLASVKLFAKWIMEDHIIGAFTGNSWVVAGKTIQLESSYASNNQGTLKWKSDNTSIATVDQTGTVKGVGEGLVTITVYDADYPSINFKFYVTCLGSNPTGIVSNIVNSNNSTIFTKDNLLVGIKLGSDGAYLVDILGSVSKLLFKSYSVNKSYYLSSPSNKSTLTGSGKGGVDYITVHYAADMPYSANYSLKGGMNLASYNKSCNTSGSGASWHYSVGNDGVFYCQNTAYGAWHAGSSKTMTWTKTSVAYSASDPEFPVVTLKNGYFYINGKSTGIKNSTSGSKLNGFGLGTKVSGGYYYLGGHYYNSSYGYIASTGGNNNSIGMETSVRQGSDLWLTWQYTAQLCANLLIQFELPIQRLVGHHFFSGKWCPQPMLENDMEIWWEFVEMVKQEMDYFNNYSNYTLSFNTNSKYLGDYGRVKSLPEYTECITYNVTYTSGGTSKTITLSTILPGTIA